MNKKFYLMNDLAKRTIELSDCKQNKWKITIILKTNKLLKFLTDHLKNEN